MLITNTEWEDNTMKKIITIGREFGSAGHDIGKLIASELGYTFYDKKLVEMAAEKSNLSGEAVKKLDEKATSSLLYSLASGSYSLRGMGGPLYYEMPLNDKLFLAQSDIIKNIAAKENSVIVGRCANYVLDTLEDVELIKVFIYADFEFRLKRVMDALELDEKHAKDKINKTDKQRKIYYNYYSNLEWGKMSNYDICVNSGKFGIEQSAKLIVNAIRSLEK